MKSNTSVISVHLTILVTILSMGGAVDTAVGGATKSELDKLVCISDFQAAAKSILTDNTVWGHIEMGVDEEFAVQANRNAYIRYAIRPRFLRNVTERILETNVLGKPVAFPLGISPTGEQKMVHIDGELANAKAAGTAGVIFILSITSTYSIEEVAKAAKTTNTRLWFQLEMLKNHALNLELLKRAEKSGFEAVVLTVDAQVDGNHRYHLRQLFEFTRNGTKEELTPASFPPKSTPDENQLDHDTSTTWKVVDWIRKNTNMKLVIKGIMTGEDASIAAARGVDAIIVSNHGGRMLDSVLPTIEVLPEVVAAVPNGFEVYLDGGIMLGQDIFKALALGAKMVFVGRAPLWGLAVGGEQGVVKVLEIYRAELDATMGQSGVSDVADINPRCVQRKSECQY